MCVYLWIKVGPGGLRAPCMLLCAMHSLAIVITIVQSLFSSSFFCEKKMISERFFLLFTASVRSRPLGPPAVPGVLHCKSNSLGLFQQFSYVVGQVLFYFLFLYSCSFSLNTKAQGIGKNGLFQQFIYESHNQVEQKWMSTKTKE